jgi:hypothetical protein
MCPVDVQTNGAKRVRVKVCHAKLFLIRRGWRQLVEDWSCLLRCHLLHESLVVINCYSYFYMQWSTGGIYLSHPPFFWCCITTCIFVASNDMTMPQTVGRRVQWLGVHTPTKDVRSIWKGVPSSDITTIVIDYNAAIRSQVIISIWQP